MLREAAGKQSGQCRANKILGSAGEKRASATASYKACVCDCAWHDALSWVGVTIQCPHHKLFMWDDHSQRRRVETYAAVLLRGSSRGAAHHTSDSAGSLGGASRAGVTSVVSSKKRGDSLELDACKKSGEMLSIPCCELQSFTHAEKLLFSAQNLTAQGTPDVMEHCGQRLSER
jgi:hypothetical protein